MEQKGRLEHIIGLRGLAAILLTLFYLNSQTWAHGYLGIDIFLVVTGYLLFSSRKAFRGTETLRDALFFLLRRLQKIIPPTATIIILSVVAGACLLWWEDELYLAELGLNACIARANVMISGESQHYLSAETTFMPLRHLWYISALVQIYLLWCVGNQLLQKRPKEYIIGALSVVALISLAYSYSYTLHEWLAKGGVQLWHQESAPSYCELLPRLWEVLAGGLVTLLPSMKTHRFWVTFTTLIGVILVLVAVLAGSVPGTGFAEELPARLMVVVGTVIVMRYLPTSSLSNLLTYRPLRWLGNISFSLFLVSMPIISFGHLWAFGAPSLELQVLLLALVLLLAWALRKLIEKREVMPEVTLGLWVGAMLLCGAGMLTDGFKNYVPSVKLNIPTHQWQLCRDDRLRTDWDPALDFSYEVFKYLNVKPKKMNHAAPLLTLGDQNRRPSIVLIGDSHAAHIYAGVNQLCKLEDLGGVYVSTNFYPFHNWKAYDNTAKEHALLSWLRKHPELTHVIIAQRWITRREDVAKFSGQTWANAKSFEDDLRSFLRELAEINKKVIIAGPGPEFRMRPLQHYCKVLNLRNKTVADIAPVCTREEYLERNKDVLPLLHKMEKENLCTVLDPMEALDEGANFLAAADNTLLMYDQHHMYAEHSIFLIERLIPRLRQMLGIVSDKPVTPTRKSTDQRRRK